jgi:salicylate hydroxylase
VKDIPDLPLDSNHWWGPETNFFASILGKNQYAVVGDVNISPNDTETGLGKVEWDQEASVKLFRDTYAVSQASAQYMEWTFHSDADMSRIGIP